MTPPQHGTTLSRLRTAARALALATAITAGGVAALATPAAAATLGNVQVTGTGAKSSNPYSATKSATWGKAWDECKRVYGNSVKSVELLDYDYWDEGSTRYYSGHWACRDTA